MATTAARISTKPNATSEYSTPASKPPRVDGPYIGGTIAAGGSFVRVNNFPTPDPFSGGTASLRVGQAIYPWMTIGLEVTGSWANRFADPRHDFHVADLAGLRETLGPALLVLATVVGELLRLRLCALTRRIEHHAIVIAQFLRHQRAAEQVAMFTFDRAARSVGG